MHASLRIAPALVPVALLLSGCITINALGQPRRPLLETVVDGERGPKVLLLDIDDVITEFDVNGPFGLPVRESTVARVREQLDLAEENEDIAGLLLRINSPGGTVTASDIVYREILRFKQENGVPVVAEMMGVAASGGYYVAMASDVVLAHPTTITGSIGVISAGLNFSGLMERFGVADQTIAAGQFKDAGSPLRPMTDEERAYLQALVDQLHARFRQVVEKGRPALAEARVGKLSDGRVFTAAQAEREGLIDGIGYLPDAVAEIARRLGTKDVQVVSYHRRREWRSNLYSTAPLSPVARSDVATLLGLGRGPTFLYLWWPQGL